MTAAQKIKAFLLDRVNRQWTGELPPRLNWALLTWRILRPILKGA